MSRICWSLIEFVCRTLDEPEREAVLGDLTESGRQAAQALSDTMGLVIRRQFGLWRDWRPWIALLAVAGVAAVPLSSMTFKFGASIDSKSGRINITEFVTKPD